MLKICCIRHWNIYCCYSLSWTSQIIKGFCFINNRNNFSSNSTLRISILDSHKSSCFYHTSNYCVSIQWSDTSQVDNLAIYSLLSKLFCCFKREFHIPWICNNCHILSSSHYFGFSYGNNKIIIGNFFRNLKTGTIEILIFKEHNRIRISNGCF